MDATNTRLRKRAEAAAYLGFAEKTLREWTSQGKGPTVTYIGRNVRYLQEDLDKFVQEQRLASRAA